jgi:hypothetical protein
MRKLITSDFSIPFAAMAVTIWPAPGWPHHSYAMFDGARTAEVRGTVARLEWRNPHVYLWIYVPGAAAGDGTTLYAFENGAINVLARRGWSKDVLRAGDAIVVTYWPLKDGRPGGHFKSGTLVDGRVLQGSGGPRDVAAGAASSELPR